MSESPTSASNDRLPPRPVDERAGQGMEFREVVALLLAGKWWIGGITSVVLALALAYAFLATPIYSADSMLQIQQQTSPLTSLTSSNSLLSTLFGSSTQAEAEIQIMTSRAVLDPVIRRLRLNIRVSGASPVAVVVDELAVPSAWLSRRLRLRAEGGDRYTLSGPGGEKVLAGRVGQNLTGDSGRVEIHISRLALAAGKTAFVARVPVQEAFADLSGRLSAVELGKDTGIVQLSLTGPHPRRIRRIVNALVDQYLVQNVAAYSAQARRSLQFVNKQLPALKKKMNAAESRLTAYQVSHDTVDIDQEAQAMLQEFDTLEGELSQLELAQAALGEQYTDKYPAYAAVEQQQASVKGKIAELEGQLEQLPKKEQGYVRLRRDAEVYTTLYTTLLGEGQDLRVVAAGTVGSARVVDRAVTPRRPIAPHRVRIGLFGLTLGLLLGVGFLFLRRALARGITDPLELEQRFGAPVYAVVPRSVAEKRLNKRRGGEGAPDTVLAHVTPNDPAVEALRSLRTNLEFALRDAKNRIVGISGPGPGVGKSFVAANLAYLSAIAGRRTLLADCDLRRGHLQRYLGQRYAPGVAELLAGSAQFADCLVPGLLGTTLDFVPTGAYPPNPSELFLTRDIGGLLTRMVEGYDVLFVDLPPILTVTDPAIAMRSTGVNFVVLRAGRHAMQEVAFALGRLRQNDITVAGLLVNDFTRRAADYGYGGYGSYYYQEYAPDGARRR